MPEPYHGRHVDSSGPSWDQSLNPSELRNVTHESNRSFSQARTLGDKTSYAGAIYHSPSACGSIDPRHLSLQNAGPNEAIVSPSCRLLLSPQQGFAVHTNGWPIGTSSGALFNGASCGPIASLNVSNQSHEAALSDTERSLPTFDCESNLDFNSNHESPPFHKNHLFSDSLPNKPPLGPLRDFPDTLFNDEFSDTDVSWLSKQPGHEPLPWLSEATNTLQNPPGLWAAHIPSPRSEDSTSMPTSDSDMSLSQPCTAQKGLPIARVSLHSCSECHDSFSDSFSLQRHSRQHRRLVCRKDCSQVFNDRQTRARHEDTMHNAKILGCPNCYRQFNRRDNLKRHESKQHNKKQKRN